MRRIAIYFVQQSDLGHTKRILNIAEYLERRHAGKFKLYIFQAGTVEKFLSFPREITWFDLPYPFYNKSKFYGRKLRVAPAAIKIREKFLLKKIQEIDPDIFITEFFPFGRVESQYELLPTLSYLKKKRKRLYVSLAHPHFLNKDINHLISLCNLYDRILIHSPENLDIHYFRKFIKAEAGISKKDYSDLFKVLGDKIIYTGYILPLKLLNLNKGFDTPKDGVSIFVSRGSGAVYPKIIVNSLKAASFLEKRYKFYIVAGPATTDREMRLFSGYTNQVKNVQISLKKLEKKFVENLLRSNIFIGTCGYNNFVQLLYLKKRAILIPFMGYSVQNIRTEQLAHAYLLKDYIGARILKYFEFSPRDLAREIERRVKVRAPSLSLPSEYFRGGEKTCDFLMRS